MTRVSFILKVSLAFYFMTQVSTNASDTNAGVDVANGIAVRIYVKNRLGNGGQMSTAYFFSRAGIAVTASTAFEIGRSGSVLVGDRKEAEFRIIHSNTKLNYSALVLINRGDVPLAIPSIQPRNTTTLQIGEPVIARYGIGDGLLCTMTGNLSTLPKHEVNDNLVVELPLTLASLGAPVIDRNGLLIGHIVDSLDVATFALPLVRPYSQVLESLNEAEGYNRRFNELFDGVTLDADTLEISHVDQNHKVKQMAPGFKIESACGLKVSSLHELKLMLWASEERSEDRLTLNLISGKDLKSVAVKFDLKSKELVGEVESLFTLPPPN